MDAGLIRPVPHSYTEQPTLTHHEIDAIGKKKKAFNDVKLIQKIYGVADTNPVIYNREFRRHIQRRNSEVCLEYGATHHPVLEQIHSWEPTHEQLKGKCINQRKCNLIWVDSNLEFRKMLLDINENHTIAVDIEEFDQDCFAGYICLIQISTDMVDYVIDAIAMVREVNDSLAHILQSPSVLKIFHGASNDLRHFQRDFGIMPFPVVDTQELLKAKFGILGLEKMCMVHGVSTADCSVKKIAQLSDFRTRPLHPKLRLGIIHGFLKI